MSRQLSDRDAFYEKMYFHELAERDRLDDRFRTLLTIVVIVFAMISYLFNAVVIDDVSNVPLLFWLVYAIAVASFIAAITCYIKAWHSQHYNAFPMLHDIEQYIDQIQTYYREQTDERTAMQWTEQAFSDYMRQSFIDHASFNVRANDNKRFWLYYGNSFIISAFLFTVMAFFPVSHTFFDL